MPEYMINNASVSQFSHSVVSDSVQPHEPQHARPPCPSPTPRVYPNLCPLSRWWHPTISSSIVPFSSCPQASGSFPISQLFTSGGQSIGVSASTSVLPMNTQDWSPLGWSISEVIGISPSIFPSIRVFSNESALCIRWPKYWSFSFNISPSNEHPGLISFRMDWLDLHVVQGTLKVFSNTSWSISSKASILQHSVFFMVQLSHLYMTIGKTIALTRFCQQSDLELYISPKIHLPCPIQSLQTILTEGTGKWSHVPSALPAAGP